LKIKEKVRKCHKRCVFQQLVFNGWGLFSFPVLYDVITMLLYLLLQ